MKKNNLMVGALVLSIGSVLAKVFSAIYRIVLTRILGGEGIGLYQLIFPFYSLCVVFATAGLPMAISKVVSKNRENKFGVIKKCFVFTSVIALLLTLILILSSRGLAILQGQKQLTTCYLILAPTIILVSVSSVLKGYFQGEQNFVPSSLSNICEQFTKMVVGLILSLSLIRLGLLPAIIGSVIGIVISEVVSVVVLLLHLKKVKVKENKVSTVSIKELVKDVLPITLTNIILPISTFIDSILVVNLLSINFTNNMSVFLYGIESGAVSSLVSIPTIFSFAIASVVLPNITHTKHTFNQNQKLLMSLKLVLIITIPCVICFTLVPNRLIEFLYQNKINTFGLNGINVASKLLAISGFGIVFLAINQVYSSVLQAIEERYVAIRNLTIAIILKFVIEIIFMPSKILNIYALAVANTLCYVTAMILNHMEIKANFKLKIHYTFWAKLILSNSIMVISLVSVMALNSGMANTLLAVFIAGLTYIICLYFTKIFNSKDKALFKYKV